MRALADTIFANYHSEWCQWFALLLMGELAERHVAQCSIILNTETFDQSHSLCL